MSAKTLILSGYGLNCEEETLHAFEHVGLNAEILHINDLIDAPGELKTAQILVIPGGFSYGDDTGSGNAFAQKMKLALWDHLQEFIARDTLTFGICNGCQIVNNLGLTPTPDHDYGERIIAVTHNMTARYQCRWIDVEININNHSPWLSDIKTMHIPVAHGEGRFMMADSVLHSLTANNQIAAQYIDPQNGNLAGGVFPQNPNGSLSDIAGITDATGRVLTLMPHPERGMFNWQRDDYDALKDQARRSNIELPEEADGIKIFRNAAKYFEVAAKKTA